METPNDALEAAEKLLPAWFVSRMMRDYWTFGLLLVTGHVLVIHKISAIRQAADGTLWLDVEMSEKNGSLESETGEVPSKFRYLLAPTERKEASVNSSHVVAAFELAST